jgi:diguanylate cyclase (GGDEF)-like protein
MSGSAGEPSVADELATLSARAGDVHVVVSPDAICLWSSDASVRPSLSLLDSFVADDSATVTSLLGTEPTGPAWVRLAGPEAARWVTALATPRSDGGWTMQLRDAHQLDPTSRSADVRGTVGIADREQVLNEVAWLLSATPRTGKEIAVASCDLDDLAFVNEEYGREAGDEVLRIVTGRISDALRSGDLVARLEDDQLLVVLRGVHHLRGALRVANKIRAAVEDPIPMPFGDLIQTICVGVTLISRGESVDSVLERAEGAMAMAKEAGHNNVMSSPPI